MKGWIAQYLKYVKDWESPTSFHIAAALTTLAGSMERKVWVRPGDNVLYPNLYLIVVGPPASKKSTAGKISMSLLREVPKVVIGPDNTTKEQLYMQMEDSHKFFDLAGERTFHTSMTIMSSEWSFLIGYKDIDFLNALIKLYDCEDTFQNYTKTQGKDDLENVFFNMFGCIQPSTLADCLPVSAIGSGFTSRLIYVVERERRHDHPFPLLPSDIRSGLITELVRLSERKGELELSRQALNFYKDWYMIRNTDSEYLKTDERFKSYLERKPQHLMKVAICMAASRDLLRGMTIEREDLQLALQWLDSLEDKMPEAYAGFGTSKHSAMTFKIMDFIIQRKTTNTGDILNYYWRDVSFKDLVEILDTIGAKPDFEVTMAGNGGREITYTGGKSCELS